MNKREIGLLLSALNRMECDARIFAGQASWKIWTRAEKDAVKRHAELADELAILRIKVGGIPCEEVPS